MFPTDHMKALIEAAVAGKTTLSRSSSTARRKASKVYETLAVIGRRIEPGAEDELEDAREAPGLACCARWPVTISYFKAGRRATRRRST